MNNQTVKNEIKFQKEELK